MKERKYALENLYCSMSYSFDGVMETLKDILEQLIKHQIEQHGKTYPEFFSYRYDWNDENRLLIWSFIVTSYGDYGTSPRGGWVEPKEMKELRSDIESIIKDYDDEEDD